MTSPQNTSNTPSPAGFPWQFKLVITVIAIGVILAVAKVFELL